MRSAAVYQNRVVADALSRGLQLAFESRSWLQHEHKFAAPRGLFRELPGCFRSHLLVGIQLHHDAMPNGNVEFAKSAHRIDEERQAAFHVENARTPQTAVRFPERHGLQGSKRPHGIRMPQRKDLAFTGVTRQMEFAPEVLTECAAWNCLDQCDAADLRGEQVHEAIYGCRVVTGGFAFRQFAY